MLANQQLNTCMNNLVIHCLILQRFYIVTSSLLRNATVIGVVIYHWDTVAPALPITDAFALTYAVLLHRHCH